MPADPRNRDRFVVPMHAEVCAGDEGDHEACTGMIPDPAYGASQGALTRCKCRCHDDPYPFEHDG